MKITVIYCKNGIAISDFEIDDHMKILLEIYISQDENRSLAVSTENFIHALRLAVAEGKFDCKDIVFRYDTDGEELVINEYGVVTPWPDGFCDVDCKTSEKIIITSMKRSQKDRLEKKMLLWKELQGDNE